jgi:hypothetical protein
VLRNGADREQTSNPSIGLNELAGITAPSPSAAVSIAKLPHPKAKEYEVVTILGDKQVVNSFDTNTHVDAHE